MDILLGGFDKKNHCLCMCCSLKNVATSQLGSVVTCSDIVDSLQKFANFQNHYKFLQMSHYKKNSWFSFSFYSLILWGIIKTGRRCIILSFQDQMHLNSIVRLLLECHCKAIFGDKTSLFKDKKYHNHVSCLLIFSILIAQMKLYCIAETFLISRNRSLLWNRY